MMKTLGMVKQLRGELPPPETSSSTKSQAPVKSRPLLEAVRRRIAANEAREATVQSNRPVAEGGGLMAAVQRRIQRQKLTA